MQHLPNVLSASLTTHTPLNGSLWSEPIVRAGEPLPERDTAFAVAAGPHFFATMQTPLRSGREFNDRDTPTSQPVAVVNEAFAQKYFAGTNPIGQRLGWPARQAARARDRRRGEEYQQCRPAHDANCHGLSRVPAVRQRLRHYIARGACPELGLC